MIPGLGISFLSLLTLGLELGNTPLRIREVEGAPVMRTWNIVHMPSRVHSLAAKAFRYAVLESAETYLRAHDAALLGSPPEALTNGAAAGPHVRRRRPRHTPWRPLPGRSRTGSRQRRASSAAARRARARPST